MSWHAIAATAIGLGLALTNQTVSAQDAKDPSTDAMIEALAPAAPRTRSLRNLQAQPRQIDLNIQFDFDSSRLRPESLELVERLAAALKSDRLRDQRFRIEGHTDAKGRADYNQQLSDRRAGAVRRMPPGVRDSLGTMPGTVNRLPSGRVIACSISRAR